MFLAFCAGVAIALTLVGVASIFVPDATQDRERPIRARAGLEQGSVVYDEIVEEPESEETLRAIRRSRKLPPSKLVIGPGVRFGRYLLGGGK